MQWLAEIIQEVVNLPLCIDSPNIEALAAGLSLCRRQAVINSITAEEERWQAVLPLIIQHRPKVVALCLDSSGMPESVADRMKVTDKLINGLVKVGVSEDDIYVDPLIKPLSVNHLGELEALDSIRAIREEYPGIHLISGLSNVSFGLPERRVLNRAFMTMSVAVGMDAFISDPLDAPIMSLLAAAKVLAGKDEYCMDYITRVRAGQVKA